MAKEIPLTIPPEQSLRDSHDHLTGSPAIEDGYSRMMELQEFDRSVVWRKLTPPVSRKINFIGAYRPESPIANLVSAELFLDENDDHPQHFVFIYQTIPSLPSTLMTYIVASGKEIILNRAVQIATHGTYTPKVFRVTATETLPVIRGYRGGASAVTLSRIFSSFPIIADHMPTHLEEYYATNRLASYILEATHQLGIHDDQQIVVKLLTHHPPNGRYVAEITNFHEEEGVASFQGLRCWETNDPSFGASHQWTGPLVPQRQFRDIQQIDVDQFDSLKVVNMGYGEGAVPWLVGILVGANPASLLTFHHDNSISEGIDLLLPLTGQLASPMVLFDLLISLGMQRFISEDYLPPQ